VKVAILFLVYFLTAKFGLGLGAVSGFATLVWPPTGIALISLLLMGYRYWPAIAAGAFLINWLTGASIAAAMAIAFGNTIEALVGVYLLKRIEFDISLRRVKDVFGLIIYAAGISTLFSATIGVTTLLAGGVVTLSSFMATWTAWWLGDMLGDLVIAPFLLSWITRFRHQLKSKQILEAIALFISLATLNALVFWEILPKDIPFIYLTFPLLIWAAFRFEQPVLFAAMLLTSGLSIWGTYQGYGPFVRTKLSDSLLNLQMFAGILSSTTMLLSALVAEREEVIEELKIVMSSRENFFVMASHELRTPLTVIRGNMAVIAEYFPDKLDLPKLKKMVADTYNASVRLIVIIKDFIDSAALEQGALSLKSLSVDMRALIQSSVNDAQPLASRKNLALEVAPLDKPLFVVVDPLRAKQVLDNLLGNAVSYSERGKIRISVMVGLKFLQILVSDTGVGIPKDRQAFIFNKFQQGQEKVYTRTSKGTGMGLYVSKLLAEKMGGDVKLVSSEVDGGSVFGFTLPLPE
jgi:signal transduction histidine kinase